MVSKGSHRVIVIAEVMVELKVMMKGSCRDCGTSHPPQRCPACAHNCGIDVTAAPFTGTQLVASPFILMSIINYNSM